MDGYQNFVNINRLDPRNTQHLISCLLADPVINREYGIGRTFNLRLRNSVIYYREQGNVCEVRAEPPCAAGGFTGNGASDRSESQHMGLRSTVSILIGTWCMGYFSASMDRLRAGLSTVPVNFPTLTGGGSGSRASIGR